MNSEKAMVLSFFATLSSSLSMGGSLAVLYAYFRRPRANRKQLGERMVCIASVLDFFASLSFSFGRAFVPSEGESPGGACIFQAWSTQFLVAAVIW